MADIITEVKRLLPAEAWQRPVLLGISGGADSTALLLILHRLGLAVEAVHCNFHLRGEESNRDMRFVADLCQGLGVPLEIAHFNEEGLEDSGNLEELCRRQRYDLFRRLKAEKGYNRIAVAHNADDNAETFLLNLMRGCGLRGLAAMSHDNGEILRPLIGVWRAEIVEWLDSQGQEYVTDSSNLASDYRRNFLRNELLPLLETRWPEARKAIFRTQQNLRSDEALLAALEIPRGTLLSWEYLRRWPVVQGIVVRWCAARGVERPRALEMTRAAVEEKKGLQWLLPDGSRIITDREGLRHIPLTDTLPASVVGLPEGFAITETDSPGKESNDVLYIPFDVRCEPYVWRHPREGDRIKPLGMAGRSAKVAKIMKDAGLNREQRLRQWVLENSSTGEIIWLPGLKRSCHGLCSDQKAFRIKKME